MLVVGGENLIDFVQEDDGRSPPAYVAHPGGGPYNVAMAAALQGAPTTYVSPISTDTLGDLLADKLAASGATLAGGRVAAPTTLAVVSLDAGQARYAFHRTGTAERRVTAEGLRAATPAGATLFCTGTLALAAAPDAGVWEDHHAALSARIATALDPNVRADLIPDRGAYMARMERMLAVTDILKLSDEDLAWLYPGRALDEAFAHVRGLSRARIAVLTKGAEGALVAAGDDLRAVPAHPVPDLIDTVGAGDTFMATLLRQAMEDGAGPGYAPGAERAAAMVALSAKAAAINCGRAGCQPPTLAELSG
ncbi:MAG: PfkB family carbohydrate kinase [Shimia sp.]